MDFKTKFDLRRSSLANVEREMLSEIASQVSSSVLRRSAVLGGGFSNSNILLKFADGERCVLRSSAHHERLNMEADLLDFLSREAPQVPVPKVLWRSSAPHPGSLRAFVMTYIDGETLASVEDGLSRADCRNICEQLAIAAAQIHKIRFAQCGLLGPGPKVTEPFASYVGGTAGFIESCLCNPHLQRRAGIRRIEQLRRCLTHRTDLQHPSWTHQLCHSDFNQKNLLIRRGPHGRYQVAAVLDWEFASSASGVVDIGNLLRFEHESPTVESAWFADAYRAAGGHLDSTWREQALFADLLAQCAFLISVEELPKTFRTAIDVIDRTLAVLYP